MELKAEGPLAQSVNKPPSSGGGLAGSLFEEPIRGALEAAAEYLEGKIAKATPVDTQNLRHSIIAGKASTVDNQMISTVSTNVEYATVMEYGRAPGKMPPIGPLIGWVKRHSGLFQELDKVYTRRGTQKQRRRKSVSSSEAGDALRKIAIGIAFAIKKRGASVKGRRQGPTGGRGYFFFEDTLAAESARIDKRFFEPLGAKIVKTLESGK